MYLTIKHKTNGQQQVGTKHWFAKQQQSNKQKNGQQQVGTKHWFAKQQQSNKKIHGQQQVKTPGH